MSLTTPESDGATGELKRNVSRTNSEDSDADLARHHARRDRSLSSSGWTPTAPPDLPPGCVPARVSRVDRGRLSVLTADGESRVHPGAALYDESGCPARRSATGSRCAASSRSPSCPGRRAFVRTVAGRTSAAQVVAANLDVVLVVDALAGEARLRRVERYLAVAWSSGATPVVVLTKADLCDDVAGRGGAGRRGRPRRRGAAGQLGHRRGRWTPSARCCRPGRTGAMVGPSGVGKSSLVNALAGRPIADDRRDPASDGRGRHTTTARELHLLPGGGLLVDTPGMRELGAATTTPTGVDTAYADVAELAADCRFRDCGHRTEPGCAVAAAIDDGALDPARYSAWRKLQAEAHRQLLRVDARARAAEKARLRSFHRAIRGPAATGCAVTGPPVDSASVRVLVIGSGAREHALCVALSVRPRGERARLRARQRRHPRGSPSRSPVDAADPDAVAARRRRVGRRPGRHRPGGAAGRRGRRRRPGRRHRLLRPVGRGRPARGQQVLRQARDGRRRRADRPLVAGRRPGRAGDRAGRGRGRAPYVVKDDGLAAGKGVLVTDDRAAAVAHGHARARRRRRGAGRGVPRRPRGVAVRASPTGRRCVPLLPAQDFKRRDDGDGGPNTGGMGAYAPLPWAPAGPGRRGAGHRAAADRRRDGAPRRDRSAACSTPGWRSPRAACGWWSSTPASATRRPRSCCRCWRRRWPACCTPPRPARWPTHPPLRWRDGAAVTVVVAAPGYPEAPRTGDPITGADGEGVLHAGTAVGRRRLGASRPAAGCWR